MENSSISKALITMSEDVKLKCYVSTGAATLDPATISVHPRNRGVITGQAGITVSLSCGQGATFDSSGTNITSLSLDEYGRAEFHLTSTVTGTIELYLYQTNNPANNLSKAVTFNNYTKGEDDFVAYNFTSDAPADGITPCSIYLMAKNQLSGHADITVVRVTVPSTAQIIGYPNSQVADIKLNQDGSAEIDITTSIAGSLKVELTLPESSGSYLECGLFFEEYSELS